MTEGENIIEALKIVRELSNRSLINSEENSILRRALNFNYPISSWINSHGDIFCGRCFADTDIKTPYCPNCGANMGDED